MSVPQRPLRALRSSNVSLPPQANLGETVALPDRPNRRHQLSPAAGHAVAWLGEFVGTLMFLFVGYATNTVGANQASDTAVNGTKSSGTIVFIALGYALPLMVNVWIMFRVSGGHLNPAVTLGAVLAGNCHPVRGTVMATGQVLGCIIAGLLVEAVFPGRVAQANTTLGSGASTAQGFLMELFFSMQLMLVVLFVGAEKTKDSIIVPVGVGLSVLAGQLAGIAFTGAAINPVRSFGCAVASLSFVSYYWIYWLGPIIGACIGAGFYRGIKWFKDQEGEWEPAVTVPVRGVEMEVWHAGTKPSPTL